LLGKKILDIVSSDKSRDIVVDEDRIYIRTPWQVTIKNVEGLVLAENLLNFNDWNEIIAAANSQLQTSQTWRRGYTIGGSPEISSEDGRYLVLFVSFEESWVIFMPDNEARKLEL
jgi:hypothetical protein